MNNEFNTKNRMVGGKNTEIIDPSLFGQYLDYYKDLKSLSELKKGLGVEYISNTNVPIVLTGPHSQLASIINTTQESLQIDENNQKPKDIEGISRVGKATLKPVRDDQGLLVRQPVRESSKDSSGMGDTLSKVIIYEITRFFETIKGELPNVVNPTYSAADSEPNSGKRLKDIPYLTNNGMSKSQIKNVKFGDDSKSIGNNQKLKDQNLIEYWAKGAARLSAKMIQNFRSTLSNIVMSNTARMPLVLNIHTALNRKDANRVRRSAEELEKYGPEKPINVVIGTTRGLSVSDFNVEINLARFLEKRGFGVVVTSFSAPPKINSEEAESEDEVAAKPAYYGEKTSHKRFMRFARNSNLDPSEFQRDKVIEEKGRLRGTDFMRALKDYVTKVTNNRRLPNILQLEITIDTLKDTSTRQNLALAIAQFCNEYTLEQNNSLES